MTNDEIEDLIQELYAWAAKRESTNKSRHGDSSFRKLDNALIRKAIKTIQLLSRGQIELETVEGPRKHL